MKNFLTVLALTATCAWAQSPVSTLEQIKIAADAGDPAAQDKMAERDSANAESWYRKAAVQGYVHAQGKLGDLLFLRTRLTIGVKPEVRVATGEESIKWATLAANQGDKQGQATLAQAYLEGNLVQQDLIEAYKWGELSAKNPSPEFVLFTGAFTRDKAVLKMTAEQIEEAHKRVAAFVPHQVAKSELPEPAWIREIKLEGISGSPDHRLAIINNKTFAKNDQMTLKVVGKDILIRCLEIRESSVVVSVEGMDGTRELKLP